MNNVAKKRGKAKIKIHEKREAVTLWKVKKRGDPATSYANKFGLLAQRLHWTTAVVMGLLIPAPQKDE